jgi:WD40 repeat protein/serine/threonine protein kinase
LSQGAFAFNAFMDSSTSITKPGGKNSGTGFSIEELLIDQARRWNAGDRVPVERYLEQYPAVGEHPEAAVDLIYGEYRLRTANGETPTAEEYVARFPQFGSQLRDQIQFHRVLAETDLGHSDGEAGRYAVETESHTSEPAQDGMPAVPGFEILGVVGKGGMGLVYKARQLGLKRNVALKVLSAGSQASKEQLSRFRSEAQFVARLQHPNIVQIFEVGEWQPVGSASALPYLALEFVEGGSLKEKIAGAPQPMRASAELVETLARAIDYAHRHRVVHRDLKPANILLSKVASSQNPVLSSPDRERPSTGYCVLTTDYSPKIADFGLAKQLHIATPSIGADYTQTGVILGTPSYMAPEQATGGLREIGVATDVYALGAILYELLTGRPPFQGDTPLSTLQQVTEDDPVAPSKLQRKLPRDLETICLKCLEKDPRKRFPTALALAEDLRRYLAAEPIQTRPVGNLERMWRWCKRKPALAAAGVLAGVALVALATLGAGYAFTLRLQREQGRTEIALQEAEMQRALADQAAGRLRQEQNETRLVSARLALERGLTLCEQGNASQGMLWLARSLQIAPEEDADLQRDIRTSMGRWRSSLHSLETLWLQPSRVWCLAVSPDGKAFVTGGPDSAPQHWDFLRQRPLWDLPFKSGWLGASAFSPDGKWVAAADPDNRIQIWDAATGKPVGQPLTQPWIHSVVFSPDEKLVLTGSADGTACLWDFATRQPLRKITHAGGEVHAVAFSPDGNTIVTGGEDQFARRWQTSSGQPIGPPLRHQGVVLAVAFSPDGQTLLTGANVNSAQLWDARTGAPIGEPLVHQNDVTAVAFSPDGSLIATASADRTVRLWDAKTRYPVGPPLPHQAAVRTLAFCHSGEAILTGGDDRVVRLWRLGTRKVLGIPLHHQGLLLDVRFSPDGKTILTGSLDGTARLWDSATGRELRQFIGHQDGVWAVAFSPDGKTLLTGSHDRTAQLWETATGKPVGQRFEHPGYVEYVAFNPRGESVAMSGEGIVQLRETRTGKRIGSAHAVNGGLCPMAFSPDGETILSGGQDGTVWLLDAHTGRPRNQMRPSRAAIHAVTFSPDGRTFLTASEDGKARLWDAATARPFGEPLEAPTAMFGQFAVAFSPDSRLLVTGGEDGIARLWNTTTGAAIGAAMRHGGKVWAVAFSADGTRIVTGSVDGTARLWDAASGKAIGTPMQHRGRVRAVAFSPDGRKVATACGDNTARLWQLPDPLMGGLEQLLLWTQVVTGMELTPEGVFQVLDSATWQQRRQRLEDF